MTKETPAIMGLTQQPLKNTQASSKPTPRYTHHMSSSDATKKPKKMGRPLEYTEERGAAIVKATEEGKTDAQMREMGLGNWETRNGYAEAFPTFRRSLARARATQAANIARRPEERYQRAEEYLLAEGDDGKPLHDVRQSGQLITLSSQRDNYDRWYAAKLDDRWADTTKVDLRATVTTLSAFVDIKPREAEVLTGDDVKLLLPHVTAPDDVDNDD